MGRKLTRAGKIARSQQAAEEAANAKVVARRSARRSGKSLERIPFDTHHVEAAMPTLANRGKRTSRALPKSRGIPVGSGRESVEAAKRAKREAKVARAEARGATAAKTQARASSGRAVERVAPVARRGTESSSLEGVLARYEPKSVARSALPLSRALPTNTPRPPGVIPRMGSMSRPLPKLGVESENLRDLRSMTSIGERRVAREVGSFSEKAVSHSRRISGYMRKEGTSLLEKMAEHPGKSALAIGAVVGGLALTHRSGRATDRTVGRPTGMYQY